MKGAERMSKAGGLTLSLCCLLAICEGFDLQAAGVAAPKLAPALGLSTQHLGWFFSASTFGLIFGAILGGRLSDLYGRKIALMISVLLFGLLSIATGLAGSVDQLLLARFVTGVGLGGALPNLIALVAESMPLERRSASIGLLYASMPLGGALASLSSLIGTDAGDWHSLFYIGGAAPLLMLPLAVRFLPDLTRHLSNRGTSRIGLLRVLFGEQRGGATLLLWAAFFLALLIMYLLLNWLPSLLISRGVTRSHAALLQASFNLFGAIGSIATGAMMDLRGRRRPVTVAIFLLAGVCLLTVATADHLPLPGWLLAVGALGATICGTQSLIYGLSADPYPTAIRGSGVGMAVSFGRFGSATGPLVAAQMLAAGLNATQVLMAMLPVLAVAGLAATLLARQPALAIISDRSDPVPSP